MSFDRANSPVERPAIIGIGAAPTVTPGNAAQLGTGPTATMVGTAMGGEVTLTTGTSPSAFVAGTPITLFTVNLPSGLFTGRMTGSTMFATADPSNQAAAQLVAGALAAGTQALNVYLDRSSSNDTQLVFKAVAGSGGTPTLAASTAYKWIVSITG